tara:strand:+ start:341 stop:715 length:375 start_codon:yes stop_codon:yes gene_type:complete
MGGMASRNKGKVGEREAAKVLSELLGIEVRRAQQFAGGVDSADIIGVPGLHVEVKRVEKLRLYSAMEQSVNDGGINCPIVMHRTNNHPWLVSLRVSDLVRLSRIITDVCNTTEVSTEICGEPTQ